MNPPPLRPEVVQRRLREIRRLLGLLTDVTADDLRSDLRTRLWVERALTQVVELAVNINTHVVTALGAALPPDTYQRSFTAAGEAGLIDPDLARRLAPAAGLRNILVHGYLEVDVDEVARAARDARADFDAYVRQVARWLEARRDGQR